MLPTASRAARVTAAVSAGLATLALAGTAIARPASSAGQKSAANGYQARVVINGANLKHTFVPAGSSTPKTDPLTKPDDLTHLGRQLYVAFQNGVGSQGEPSADGNTDSTVVEFTPGGKVIRQWNLKGKCDGLSADSQRGLLIATVNEDGNSSIYTINPGAPKTAQLTHFRYPHNPLPHGGGTDAISIYHGMVLISASAPGTVGKPAPQPAYPAVYRVTLRFGRHFASLKPLFYDEAAARVANRGASSGKVVHLALTDPDSNEIVPHSGPRFAGDFMETSQGDKEQIFVLPEGTLGSHLAVLHLSQSVDDTGWAPGPRGKLYVSNPGGDTVDVISGPFRPGSVFVAVTPCDASNAPATCQPNYLGQLNPWTGHVTRVPVSGPVFGPTAMVFVGPS